MAIFQFKKAPTELFFLQKIQTSNETTEAALLSNWLGKSEEIFS